MGFSKNRRKRPPGSKIMTNKKRLALAKRRARKKGTKLSLSKEFKYFPVVVSQVAVYCSLFFQEKL